MSFTISHAANEKAEEFLPLSAAQEGIWLGHQRAQDPSIYNAAQLMILDASACVERLALAIQQTLAEATAIHINFVETESSEPRLLRRDSRQSPDIAIFPRVVTLDDAIKLARDRCGKVFELASDALFHHELIRLDDGRIAWLHLAHHILLDGYGFNLFARRVAENYELASGTKQVLGPGFTDLAQVMIQDDEYQRSEKRAEDLEFWKREQLGAPGLLWGVVEQPARGLRAESLLSAEFVQQLDALGKTVGLNFVDLALSSIARVTGRLNQRSKFSLGLPTMLRLGTASLRTPCMAMNIVPLPVDMAADESLFTLARKLRDAQARQRSHVRFRYEHLRREGLSQALFGPVVNIMPFDFPLKFGSSRVELKEIAIGPVLDLSFSLIIRDGIWALSAEGHPRLFSQDDLETLISDIHFELGSVAFDAPNFTDSVVVNSPLISDQTCGSSPHVQTSEPICPLARIKSFAESEPLQCALRWGAGGRLSYAELSTAVDACGDALADAGVKAGALVAVDLARSPLATVVLLAIYQLGAAYVVLDPEHPQARRDAILATTQPSLLVKSRKDGWSQVTDHADSSETQVRIFECSDKDLSSWSSSLTAYRSSCATENHAAYVTFTSGSSGEPKGVVTSFGALRHFVGAALQRYRILSDDRVLCFAALTFDTSVEELFVTLAAGATLVFREEGMLDSVDHFLRECSRLEISVLDLPTSYFHEVAFATSNENLILPPHLRTVIIGGEAAQVDRVRLFCRYAPEVRLVNTYGPSEATVVATSADLSIKALLSDVAPIGEPLSGVTALLIDSSGEIITRNGVVGELYLLGAALATGYLARDDLTREKFVFLADGRRAYKTGDLVSRGVYGQLFFRGRVDDELKIAGHRVAPGEVEAVVCQHPRVRHALIWGQRSPGGTQVHLCACVEVNADVTSHELMAFARDRLPNVMVPTRWNMKRQLPLTASGKLDRERIVREAAEEATISGAELHEISQGTLEKVLDAWREILGVRQIGTEQNFFDLGGNSLHVIQLANRLTQVMASAGTRKTIRVAELFQRSTPFAQATWLESVLGGGETSPEHSVKKFTPSPLSVNIASRAPQPDLNLGLERVLLTGVTGFLGVYLLSSWLRLSEARVVCLVRAKNVEDAWSRLHEQAREFDVVLPNLQERVQVVNVGDGSALRRTLAEQVSRCQAVFHCAAQVSLTRDYESLFTSNVKFTRDLLEWSGSVGAEFHFISTIATLPAGESRESFYPLHVGLNDGYQQSKAHAELLCESAAMQGLNVAVYRLGRVVGARSRPQVNANDLVWRIARSSARVGLWPQIKVSEPWAPVDELADSIVALSKKRSAQSPGRVFHLVQHGSVDLEQVFHGLLAVGISLQSVAISEWMAAVRRHADAEDLATLAFFELAASTSTPVAATALSHVHTSAWLDDLNVVPVDQNLIVQFCKSAQQRGLLKARSHFSTQTQDLSP